MKCLRSIANISLLDRITNTRILEITNNKSITDIIQRDRWLFFGKVMERDASTWWTKAIMSGRVKGVRGSRGGPICDGPTLLLNKGGGKWGGEG